MQKNKRQAQKTETRERIVTAAYEEFSRRGILHTRMADVAATAGVSHGSVFAHFPTQEELVSAVIGEYAARIAGRTHTLAEHGGTLREVLLAHLRGIAEFEPFYTRLMIELPGLPFACRSAWLSVQSAASLHIGRAAEREMEAGRIRRMLPSFLFNAWMGLVGYYLMNGDLFAPGGSVAERRGEELLEGFLGMISERPDPNKMDEKGETQ